MQASLDPQDFESARQARDPRFDGKFYVGVLTTGIYCRPTCPVRIPKKENVQLYPSAAAAAAAGFRPCLRCKPESSPGTPDWCAGSWKVSRALQLIEQGFLDDHPVNHLAARLGVGPRQLSRLFRERLGASPLQLAKTRRLQFAKKLLDETDMPLSAVCFAAGFSSVRRFNAVFLETYSRSPGQVRRSRLVRKRDSDRPVQPGQVHLQLSYRPPYDWQSTLDFLRYRMIPGVESVQDKTYARSFTLDGKQGHFKAAFVDSAPLLNVVIDYPDTAQLSRIVEKIRRIFDLRADSLAIQSDLARDPFLAEVVRRHNGLRVPGCWDGFEVCIRAILGQQVTVKAATTLAARVAEKFGEPYRCETDQLTHTFPAPTTLQQADLDGLGIVGQRVAAIRAVSQAVSTGKLGFDPACDSEAFISAMCHIKGIGEWTARYVAMRALGDPDAFPYGDLILRRAAAPAGETLSPRQLLNRSQNWQPWRAYAVIFLWKHYANQKGAGEKK